MQSHRLLRTGAWLITAVFASNNAALAGPIALADAPLVTGLSKTVAPNVLFILDDSGSMNDAFMPDSANNNYSNGKPCSRNFGYNTIYFNPSTTYTPPVKADGTSYANASATSAYDNGFTDSGGPRNLTSTSTVPVSNTVTVNLGGSPLSMNSGSSAVTVSSSNHGLSNGTSVTFSGLSSFNGRTNGLYINGNSFSIYNVTTNTFQIFANGGGNTANNTGNYGGSNGSYDYTVTVNTTVPNYYYYTHATNPSTCASDGSYTQVGVNSLNATQQQNFANWYSYYRTRLLLMKTAAGRAFSGVTSDYRVGFTVISDSGTNSSFLGVSRFDAAQKTAWYDSLYTAGGSGYTPLRGALSKAGRYYAGTLGGSKASGNNDPVQYSCQQNFTILTTDGYWNTNSESGSYGPKREDNSTNVGDQDSGSGTARPYRDDLAKSNTLADVAMYYYKTDLRSTAGLGGLTDEGTRIDVSVDNVPETNTDKARHQHMVTFTLGLGVDGSLSNPADMVNLEQGTKNWGDPIGNSTTARIDDLWHAAVNGRGQYLSAKNAQAVEDALSEALESIKYEHGSSAAAATSNLQPVAGDNTAFIAQYDTGYWVGDLLARSIDVGTGAISTTNLWSAQQMIDSQRGASTDSRSIYTYSSASANRLKEFRAVNLGTEIASGYFNTTQLTQYTLGQWNLLQSAAATPAKLIDYLRGQTGNEDQASALPLTTDLFRKRQHALGDISSAAPVYVRKPVFQYVDAGYTSFLSSQSNRLGTVYVGANDGMLHAIDASSDISGNPTLTSGLERWAYIPSMVIPQLYRLADGQYAGNHRFYVDGPIQVGDAYNTTTSQWATILVGGLGHGGRGYYALDVTNPASPKALWEFNTTSDADIGYSYGNPVITKRASDGRWVVIFASGYNNTSPGDGRGRLYVIDAFTGAKLSEIVTDTAVNNENLSGIGKISNYVEDGLKNNLTQYVYSGDLAGNLWRFDINTGTRVLMGTTSAVPGQRPITVQPELSRIRDGAGNWHRVVYFGTGRGLGPNDLSPSDTSYGVAQTVFAVKDTGTSLGVLTNIATSQLVSQPLDANVTPRVIDPLANVDWQMNNGWFVNVPVGERFYVDPGLQLGTLVIAANIAEQGYCEPTGRSVLYQLDYKSGNVLMTSSYQAQIVGITQLQTQGGSGPVVIDPVFADGTTGNTNQISTAGGAGVPTRVSWREIE